jgi:hypothetical protein
MRIVFLLLITLFSTTLAHSQESLSDKQVYSLARCLYISVLPSHHQSVLDLQYLNYSSGPQDDKGVDQKRRRFHEEFVRDLAPSGKIHSGIIEWYRANFSNDELSNLHTMCQTPEFRKTVTLRTKAQKHVAELTEESYFDALSNVNKQEPQ